MIRNSNIHIQVYLVICTINFAIYVLNLTWILAKNQFLKYLKIIKQTIYVFQENLFEYVLFCLIIVL